MILGAGVALFVQWTKKVLGTSEYVTLGMALGLSLSAAITYTLLVNADMWETVKSVLLTAGAFYTFVIARFEK